MCLKTGLCRLSECGPSEFNPFLVLTKADVPHLPIHFLLQCWTPSHLLSPSQLVGWLARSLARGDDSLNRIPLATANLASSLSLPSLRASIGRRPTQRKEQLAQLATRIARGISSHNGRQINISNVRMKQQRLTTGTAYFLCDIQIHFGSLSEALGKENILERVGAGRVGVQ